jgi:hypothetical protein
MSFPLFYALYMCHYHYVTFIVDCLWQVRISECIDSLNSSQKILFLLLRYLCSCRQVSKRAWSTKKVLRNVTIIIFAGAMLINWPYLVFSKNGIDSMTGLTSCAIQAVPLLQFNVNANKTWTISCLYLFLNRHTFKCRWFSFCYQW